MRHITHLAVLLAVFGCKKKESDAPQPGASPAATTPAAAPMPARPPTPAEPPPTPVAMTAEELRPTCAKIVTAELAAKTHGATEVKDEALAGLPRGAMCSLLQGTEQVGSIMIACKPDLDVSAIERERAAMTKAVDLPTPVGRGGYRISSIVFYNDDETPCRLQVAFNSVPSDAALTTALRAIMAAVTPTSVRP